MADDALTQSFRAAANTLTVLYKESITQQKRGHLLGYRECLEDIIKMLQKSDVPVNVSRDELVRVLADKLHATFTTEETPINTSTPEVPAEIPSSSIATPAPPHLPLPTQLPDVMNVHMQAFQPDSPKRSRSQELGMNVDSSALLWDPSKRHRLY